MSTEIERWAQSWSEPLTYLVFFGVLALCAAAEVLRPNSLTQPHRRDRWPINAALTLGFVIVIGILPVSLFVAARWSKEQDLGLLHQLELQGSVALSLGLLLRSFVSFATHWSMHKVPWFWRVHRVHHSDVRMDVSTTVRFHPLEPVVTLLPASAAIIVLGIDPTAVLLYELLDAAVTVWSHANVRWPETLTRVVGCVFVTPDQHRVHHHPALPWTDSNFGATLNIWDRLFGTFRELPTEAVRETPVGLTAVTLSQACSLRALCAMPFREPLG